MELARELGRPVSMHAPTVGSEIRGRPPESPSSPLSSVSPVSPVSIGEIAAVILLTALALVLRLRGIDFLLPILPLSDSTAIGDQVDSMRGKPWVEGYKSELAPYPLLLARMTTLLPEPPDVPPGPAPSLEDHLRVASEPWRQIRLVSAVLSVLIVPGTWLLARRFLSPGGAVLAAALVATSLLHIHFASHEKPHGPLSAFVVLTVVAGIRLRRRGDGLSYLLTGLAMGLSVGILHSGILALLVLPTALALRELHQGHRTNERRRTIGWSIAALAIVAPFGLFSYPAVVRTAVDRVLGRAGDAGDALRIGDEISINRITGEGFRVFVEALWSHDPVLFVGVALALVIVVIGLLRRTRHLDVGQRKDLLVALSLALPYLGMVGSLAITQERYFPPLMSFVACLAAFALVRTVAAVVARWTDRDPERALAPALCAVFPALAFIPAWRIGEVRAAPDTFTRAASFLESHAKPDEDRILIAAALDLPLLHGEAALAENSRHPARSSWVRYQMRVPPALFSGPRYEILIAPGEAPETKAALQSDPIAYFQKHGARWVVLSLGSPESPVRRVLREKAELAGRIVPDAEDHGGSSLFTYMGGRPTAPWSQPFWLFVMSMQSMGYTFEIYRLR